MPDPISSGSTPASTSTPAPVVPAQSTPTPQATPQKRSPDDVRTVKFDQPKEPPKEVLDMTFSDADGPKIEDIEVQQLPVVKEEKKIEPKLEVKRHVRTKTSTKQERKKLTNGKIIKRNSTRKGQEIE